MELRRQGKKSFISSGCCWRLVQPRFSQVSSETFVPIRCDSVIAYDRKVERGEKRVEQKSNKIKLRHITNCQFNTEGSTSHPPSKFLSPSISGSVNCSALGIH